jgi:3-deoxy-D-manno-octulosonic-acid transferase
MLWLYNFGITLYSLVVRLVAPFNPKAKLFVRGRQQTFQALQQQIDRKVKHIWFHFASLGEFEQGRPVLEKIKHSHPEKPIVVTFFSPSGYEIRKNYPLAAGVFYLPLDTRRNAKRFIEAINPELAVFTKYEFWHHYYKTLKYRQIPLFLISGIFRPKQVFFKKYGGFYRNILKNVTYFFVQNEESVDLLNGIGITQAQVAGDTRFDRVFESAEHPLTIQEVKDFCAGHRVFLGGSTWPADEQLLAGIANENLDWKFILAPHEIHEEHLGQIQKLFPQALRYSKLKTHKELNAQVLIIDNIGMLSALYQYADVAYIGGGFGVGIHNTLEAAAFGKPVLFGPNYHKFQEAKDLLQLGAAISISNALELKKGFEQLKGNSTAGSLARSYVADHKGATETIYQEIKRYFSL